MSTITVSKAKKLVGDRDCHIGDPPITVPSSLGNVIGIGGHSGKLDAETQAAKTNAALDQHQLF